MQAISTRLPALPLESGVDPGLAQGRVGGGRLVEQLHAEGVVADGRGGDDNGEQQAEGVGDDAAFTADDLLPASTPCLTAGTLVEAFTLRESMMEPVGVALLPDWCIPGR